MTDDDTIRIKADKRERFVLSYSYHDIDPKDIHFVSDANLVVRHLANPAVYSYEITAKDVASDNYLITAKIGDVVLTDPVNLIVKDTPSSHTSLLAPSKQQVRVGHEIIFTYTAKNKEDVNIVENISNHLYLFKDNANSALVFTSKGGGHFELRDVAKDTGAHSYVVKFASEDGNSPRVICSPSSVITVVKDTTKAML